MPTIKGGFHMKKDSKTGKMRMTEESQKKFDEVMGGKFNPFGFKEKPKKKATKKVTTKNKKAIKKGLKKMLKKRKKK